MTSPQVGFHVFDVRSAEFVQINVGNPKAYTTGDSTQTFPKKFYER